MKKKKEVIQKEEITYKFKNPVTKDVYDFIVQYAPHFKYTSMRNGIIAGSSFKTREELDAVVNKYKTKRQMEGYKISIITQ